MPGYFYTADELIASVKRRAMVPASQNTFTNDDFLAFANEEMNMGIVPDVMIMHEDYFLRTTLIPLKANQTKYPIPYRAIGNKLREVSFQDSNGNVYEMTRIGVGDLPFYSGSYTPERAYAFYMENNMICLAPEMMVSPASTFLRVTYYIRPNTLVLLADVAPITAIDLTTGIIQVSNLPADFNQSKKLDLIQLTSPHKILSFDVTAAAINSTSKTITLNLADIPSELSIGDHICLATEAAIPQIPSDLHVMLAHRVAARCLEALGDTEGLQNANQKLAEMRQQAQTLTDNRVEDAPMKINNRHSTLRRGLFARRFRWRS